MTWSTERSRWATWWMTLASHMLQINLCFFFRIIVVFVITRTRSRLKLSNVSSGKPGVMLQQQQLFSCFIFQSHGEDFGGIFVKTSDARRVGLHSGSMFRRASSPFLPLLPCDPKWSNYKCRASDCINSISENHVFLTLFYMVLCSSVMTHTWKL